MRLAWRALSSQHRQLQDVCKHSLCKHARSQLCLSARTTSTPMYRRRSASTRETPWRASNARACSSTWPRYDPFVCLCRATLGTGTAHTAHTQNGVATHILETHTHTHKQPNPSTGGRAGCARVGRGPGARQRPVQPRRGHALQRGTRRAQHTAGELRCLTLRCDHVI